MLPPICEALGRPVPSVGGWLYSSLKRVTDAPDISNIAVATVYNGKDFIKRNVDGIIYYLLPLNGKSTIKYNPHLEQYWQNIKEDFKPDVVHIHGSEYPHGLAYVNACGSRGVVVSLQGIISCCARYYAAGIGYRSVKNCLTFRDFVKRSGIFKEQQDFERRGKYEIELLQSINHIIGRTDWDKAHSQAINPTAHYHYCGETLRDSFYNHKWDYSNCEPHSIFVSQASYPIKGLHILLKALPLILRQYPDTKVYVAGSDPTSLPWWRITGYGKYLKTLISGLKLHGKVIFTGMLDEQAMADRYLKSNIFVCCSAIENSPNSLGEAQLLGMPYVASFVGGVPEIVNYNPSVLYRFEEYEMLAKRICKVFSLNANVKPIKFSKQKYDPAINLELLKGIYSSILNMNQQ